MQGKVKWLQDLGRLVFSARESIGWTQKVLAGSAGLPANTVARIERGEQEPSASTLARLARALGVPADELLPPPPPDQRRKPRTDR